jgi:uncharacterized PurR-regulated membrane protein YhhQ (DUF165 family)
MIPVIPRRISAKSGDLFFFFFFFISDEVVSSFGEVMSDEVVFLGGFYRFVGRFASGMKRELAMGNSPVRFGSGEN